MPSAPSLSLTDLRYEQIYVYWKEIPRGPNAKPTKVPRNPNRRGTEAAADDPSTWGTLDDAKKSAAIVTRKGNGGVGVMLTELGDGTQLIGIDLDSCYEPETGMVAPHAAEIIKKFDGAFVEISPGKLGLKLYLRIKVEHAQLLRKAMGRTQDGTERHGKSWSRGPHDEIALHISHRFFAMTGNGFGQDLDLCQLLGANDNLGVIGLAPLLWLIHEAGPDYKTGEPRDRDSSGSGALFRLARWIKGAGGTREDFEEAIAEDADAANHVAANGDRAIDRAWSRNPEPAIDSSLEAFGPNEDGVIRALTARFANELKYDHDEGKWFRFDGNYWKREQTKLAVHLAREMAVALAQGQDGKAAVRAMVSVRTWEAIERGLRTVRQFAVTADVWNRDKMILGTPSGTVNLSTGTLRPADPGDLISRVTAVAPIPLDQFDARRDCPLWLSFLDTALAGDAGAIRLLQQWGGYSLTGETREQVLLFVHGPGGAGKGTAINTIGSILGEYGIAVAMETLTFSKHERHTTELARLNGARMARASETEKGRAWAENRIKMLTGQDTITAHFMGKDYFEFLPDFKLTIFGNNLPNLRDVDSAMKRRLIVLPFDHPPPETDLNFSAKLKAEWPGILSWLIIGCLDWQAHGLVRPAVVDEATTAYFDAEDTFAQWIAESCETGRGREDTVERLHSSYLNFSRGAGDDSISKKAFSETLTQRGFESAPKIGLKRQRGFRGILVRPASDPGYFEDSGLI